MGSLVAELAEKLSAATNNLDFDEQTMFLNTSANTVGIGTNSPGAKLDVRGSALFNEGGADVDFRIEGDSQTHLFFLDASTDRIGINNSSPAVGLDIRTPVNVGVAGTGHDIYFYGDTSGKHLLWDQSGDELLFATSTKLSFHDAGGGENILASADGHLEINAGTTLDITAATVDINSATKFNVDGPTQLTGAVTVGVDDTGHDVIFYGDTASSNMTWDASADDLILNDATLVIDQDDAAGAISIDCEATGADAVTIRSKYSLWVEQDLSGGYGGIFTRNLAEAGSYPLLEVRDEHTSCTQTSFKVRQDGTGDIVNFFDGGTEVFTVVDGGKVGIGTTAPDGLLHVFESATTHGINAGADNLIIEGTGVIGMTFASDADMSIAFSDNNASYSGRIMYDISERDLTFWTNELQRVTIDDGGNVGIGTTAPGMALHVRSAENNLLHLESTDQDALFKLEDNGSGHFQINVAADTASFGTSHSAEMLRFSGATSPESIVINEDGNEQVFRIESNNNSNSFNMDGTEGNIGINVAASSTAGESLKVYGKTGASTNVIVTSGGHCYIQQWSVNNQHATWHQWGTGGVGRWLLGVEGGTTQFQVYDQSDSSQATYVSAGGTDWTGTSDERLKKDITSMEDRLDDLLAIKVRRFKMKRTDREREGFIAQELVTHVPEAVDIGTDEVWSKEEADNSETVIEGELKNPYGVSKPALIPMIVKSIQELSAKVTALEDG